MVRQRRHREKIHRPHGLTLTLPSLDHPLRRASTSLGQSEPVKFWEIIADRLHAEGWSYGIAEHFTKHGFLFCVDAHRDGKRFIVKADDLLTAFLSLERDVLGPKEANGTGSHEKVA